MAAPSAQKGPPPPQLSPSFANLPHKANLSQPQDVAHRTQTSPIAQKAGEVAPEILCCEAHVDFQTMAHCLFVSACLERAFPKVTSAAAILEPKARL